MFEFLFLHLFEFLFDKDYISCKPETIKVFKSFELWVLRAHHFNIILCLKASIITIMETCKIGVELQNMTDDNFMHFCFGLIHINFKRPGIGFLAGSLHPEVWPVELRDPKIIK